MMSHAAFQTAQIIPMTMNTQVGAKTSLPNPKLNSLQFIKKTAAVKLRRRSLSVRASFSAEVGYGSTPLLERCFMAPPAPAEFDSSLIPFLYSAPSSFSPSSGPVMKGQFGSLASVTLEKSKLDVSQKQSTSSPEVSAAFISFYLSVSCDEISFENVHSRL